MSAKELGQQSAFPVWNGHSSIGGLTKREQFAMAAMQGILACSQAWASSSMDREILVVQSAACADALLAELAKDL